MSARDILVYGHCATWRITFDRDGFYCVGGKRYRDLCAAHRAIRVAEARYLDDNPDAPVANTHIWFDHGILICDDCDGGYYD